nr:MAG TPA: hypothetical protein [Caudoviricetes sp.]
MSFPYRPFFSPLSCRPSYLLSFLFLNCLYYTVYY